MTWLGIPVTALQGVGPSGLLVLVVILILVGRLVPRPILDDARKDRDTWRATAETQAKSLDLIIGQQDQLLEMAKASLHLLQALPPAPSPPYDSTPQTRENQ